MLPNKMGLVVCALLLTITQGGVNPPFAWSEPQPATTSSGARMTGIMESNGPLTSTQVTNLLLQYNQEIAALAWQIKSSKAAALQSVLLPNPELGVEIENFAGSGDMEGFDRAETTISLNQLIELGGKRAMRRTRGRLDVEMATLAYQARRLDLIADGQLAFIEVLAAQEKLQVTEEQLKVAKEVTSVVQARVLAGKVSPIESTKAQIALSSSRINRNKANQKLSDSRNVLALFWGSTTPIFSEAVGSVMDFADTPPNIAPLTELLANHPLMKQAALAVEQSKIQISLARAEAVPDLTVSGGYRNLGEGNNHAFVAGISIPIPTFNRNQGGITEASHDLAKAKANLAVLKSQLTTQLNRTHKELLAAGLEAKTLKEQVLPSARTTFEAIREGYRQGKFSYLEILDAQKTLFDVSLSRIEVSSAYHTSNIQLKRLADMGFAHLSINKEQAP